MEKSAISGQNPQKGTGTQSWYPYPLCRGDLVLVPKISVPAPIHSKGLVSVPIKVVPVLMLPATLFLYPLHVGHGALKACNLYCFMKTIFYI